MQANIKHFLHHIFLSTGNYLNTHTRAIGCCFPLIKASLSSFVLFFFLKFLKETFSSERLLSRSTISLFVFIF